MELVVAILAIVAMAKIASADDQSPIIWGSVTLLLLGACIALIPLPFIRVGIAAVAAFVAMIGYKVVANR